MKKSTGLGLSLVFTILGFSANLNAQVPEADEPEGERAGVLEEVMVTATRRGESDILTTPLAITSLTGDEVMTYAVQDLNNIAVDVPGLSSGTVSAFKSAQFSMRGVSETTIILYKESPVAVTQDDFVIPHIQTANLEMFDIDTIEVLRGPQGTLFGKNTTGGVINVQTKKPVFEENSAEGQFQYGSFGTAVANAALNLSFGDTVAFRFAGMYRYSDGFMKNNAVYGPIESSYDFLPPLNSSYAGTSGAGDGERVGGDDVFSGRFKLAWEATDKLSLLLQYEMVRDNGETPPIVQESFPPAAGASFGYFVPAWGFPNCEGDPHKCAGVTNRVDDELNLQDGHQVDIDGWYLLGDYELSDDYTMYFNGGTRKQKSRLPSSYTGTTGPISLFDATRDDDRQTSQAEFRVGSNLDGPFNFTAGYYWQEDAVDFCVMQFVGFLDGFGLPTPTDYFNDNPRLLCNQQRAKSNAVYFDGTWDFAERWHFTAGYRYTKEHKDWAGRPMRFFLDGIPVGDLDEPVDGADFERFPEGVVYNSHTWTEPTYRAVLGYDFTDEQFGYFNYSHGFKSGGYNDQLGTTLDPITDLAAEPTQPEIADSFEIGWKSTYADGAANTSIDAYYVTYKDAQRTFNVSFPDGQQETLFFNAAKMEVYGIEAEGAWAVTENFLLRYNGSYMHAEYKSFEADTDYDGIIDVDLSDKPVTRAPKWMGTIQGSYVARAGDSHNLEMSLRAGYESKSIASYTDVPGAADPNLNAKTLVDAAITFRDDDNRYYISLLGSNLLDKDYRTGSLSVATLWIMSAYGPPRYFGIEFGGVMDW